MESEAALHFLNQAHGGLLFFLAVPGGARDCFLKNVQPRHEVDLPARTGCFWGLAFKAERQVDKVLQVSNLDCTMEGHNYIQAAMFLLLVSLRTVPTLKLMHMLWTDLAMNIAC